MVEDCRNASHPRDDYFGIDTKAVCEAVERDLPDP
jgi:hypothetical protein